MTHTFLPMKMNSILLEVSILVKSSGVANKLAELEYKTEEITKEVIETEGDSISIEDNNGNEIFHIDENGLDAKNVKSNGKDVLTEHQDNSGLATKEELARKWEINRNEQAYLQSYFKYLKK